MAVLKRIFFIALGVIFAVSGTLLLFFPLAREAGAAREEYICNWENGTVTIETYASAYPDLINGFEDSITISRNGLRGEIIPTVQFPETVRILQTGGLAELLSLADTAVTRLERLLLWRITRGCVWYSGGYFVWGDGGFCEVGSAKGETLVLLSGPVTPSKLKATGANMLELRAEASLNADMLIGTAVEQVKAYPPYSYGSGAVYLDTGTARRLIAGVPATAFLTVTECDYIDEGALRPCVSLEELTLPFAGNAPSGEGTSFHGELAYLFSDGTNYFVPASLKRVNITGGVLVSHAFYRMGAVEEINLCGMLPGNIHADALADCMNLRMLHCPNAAVRLSGSYSASTAPCGCTVFERNG